MAAKGIIPMVQYKQSLIALKQLGYRVILSDTSVWDKYNRIRIQ